MEVWVTYTVADICLLGASAADSYEAQRKTTTVMRVATLTMCAINNAMRML